jgi:hypothetical protein
VTGLNSAAVIQAAVDHLTGLGIFESVQEHEALSAPGNGLTADVWIDSIKPAPAQSGLAASSAVLTLTCRIYLNVNGMPADGLEQQIAAATDALMTAYSADFDFGGLVMLVDLLGMAGASLSAEGGWINVGGIAYRCMTITVPCVITDVWPQVE